MKSSCNSISVKQTTQCKNGKKTWIDTFPKKTHRGPAGAGQVAQHHYISEIRIKATIIHHLIPVGMAVLQKNTDNKWWQECGEKGTPVHCWWACKLGQPLWKNSMVVSQKKKKNNTRITIWPIIPLLGINLKKKKENANSKRYILSSVHSSIIYNSPDTEST